MKHIRAIIVILIILFLFIVAVQNYNGLTVPIRFRVNLIFLEYETADMPLAFVAVVTFLVGVLAIGLYGMTERFRLKKQIKNLLAEAKERAEELNSLRNLPVTTEDMDSHNSTDT